MPERDKAAVVLLSGGIDSSVLLRHAASELRRTPIHALSFDYGQRHVKELDCSRYQAASAGVAEHRIIDVSFLGPLLAPVSALVTGGTAVPDLEDLADHERTQPPTYVPNRNMMLLAMAAAYAEAQGISDVFYGAQAQDEYGYWDCTREFLTRINALLGLNRKEPVTIRAPFVERSKAEIVRLGLELDVDFAHTWSCYRGGRHACGTCPTCVERLKAFSDAGSPDPLRYEAAP